MTNLDPIQVMVDLLRNNWNSSNTASRTPTFGKVYDYKTIFLKNGDYVLLYGDERKAPVGIGSSREADSAFIKIDIRTNVSDAQARLILEEVRRVCNNKLENPNSNYSRLDPDRDETNLSNKTRQIFRYVKDVVLFSYSRSRST